MSRVATRLSQDAFHHNDEIPSKNILTQSETSFESDKGKPEILITVDGGGSKLKTKAEITTQLEAVVHSQKRHDDDCKEVLTDDTIKEVDEQIQTRDPIKRCRDPIENVEVLTTDPIKTVKILTVDPIKKVEVLTPVDDVGSTPEQQPGTSAKLESVVRERQVCVENGTKKIEIITPVDVNGPASGGGNPVGGPTELGAISVPLADTSQHSIIIVLGIFIFSLLGVLFVYSTFPELEASEKQHFKLPRNMEDAKVLGDILSRYKDKYYYSVLSGIFFIYIFLQTFAIPGSIFLSILSGFLFSFPVALLLICFCSATGASFCYLLSYFLGRQLVYKYIPDKAREWSATVTRHKDNLINYIIFLRVTPFLPNWFINITAPVIDVPLLPFFLGTFLGVAPPSFVAIQAGTTIHQLSSSSDAVSWTSLIVLLVLGLASLIPVLFKDFFKSKFD